MLRNDVFSLPCVERKNRGGTTKNPRCEEKTHTMRLPQLPFLGRGGRQNIKGGGRQPGRQGGGRKKGKRKAKYIQDIKTRQPCQKRFTRSGVFMSVTCLPPSSRGATMGGERARIFLWEPPRNGMIHRMQSSRKAIVFKERSSRARKR